MANQDEDHVLVERFLAALPESARLLMTQKGFQLVEELGLDAVRSVVFDVLCGINIRDSTEMLTRKRLALLNAATIAQYAKFPGASASLDNFLNSVAYVIHSPTPHVAAWVLNWALGLTDKARQNVLRDGESLETYTTEFIETLKQAALTAGENYGELSGTLKIGADEIPLNWLFLLYLATSMGAQTLTIRGSDKSIYGKLFEKLVLGSMLSILGFQLASNGSSTATPGQFWLSSTSKRESDATLLIESGIGVRFDMGFIGRGNTEISLDKVSRFERVAEFNQQTYQMATFIIVDRIGKKSKLEQSARAIDGTIIQMSSAYWPQLLATQLQERFEYSDVLIGASHEEVRTIIEERLQQVPIEELLKTASPAASSEESEELEESE